MPGLWPLKVDASGCKKPEQAPQTNYDHPTRTGPTNSKPLLIPNDKTAVADLPSLQSEGPSRRVKAEEDLQSKSEGGLVGAVDEVRKASSNSPIESNSALSAKASTGGVEAAKHVDHEALGTAPKSSTAGALVKREVSTNPTSNNPECEAQGLASPPYTSSEEFGIGGQADSTYEYLPKEYLLLGGLEEKYRAMYEMAAESTIKNLLFRPMIPDEKRHLLHVGLAKIAERKDPAEDKVDLKPEGTHLGCFAGAMFAIGAKAFDRKDDMDIAWKLTDGCVWAYEATNTGIMPETYLAIPCADAEDCAWNETLWYRALDPFGDSRERSRLSRQQAILDSKEKSPLERPLENGAKTFQAGVTKASTISGIVSDSADTEGPNVEKNGPESTRSVVAASKADENAKPKNSSLKEETDELKPKADGAAVSSARLDKRQLEDLDGEAQNARTARKTVTSATATPKELEDTATKPVAKLVVEKTSAEETLEKSEAATSDVKGKSKVLKHSNGTAKATAYTPPPIPTREEFVNARIKDERLPTGMTKIVGGRYLLR